MQIYIVITYRKQFTFIADERRPPIYTSEKDGNDQTGDGSEEKPFKTALQAMRFAKTEPFPDIMVDGKEENSVSAFWFFLIAQSQKF